MTWPFMKILLVDDSRAYAVRVLPELENLGCKVTLARDGVEALEAVAIEQPDLILMDLEMPRMSGLQAIEKLRELEKSKKRAWTPIIFVTASESLEILVRVIHAGGDDIVFKSAPMEVLISKIYAMSRIIEMKRDLELANSKLHHILSSVGEGIHVIDAEGRIIAENLASMIMFGWDEHEGLIGSPGHESIHHHHADMTEFPIENCPIYLTLHDGISRHVLDDVFWRKDGTSFPVEYKCAPLRDNVGAIIGVTVVFRDISDRKKADEHLRFLAQHCPLTGLPNRTLYLDRLDQTLISAIRLEAEFSVLYIDLDKFKPVNDTYGHAVGDLLLQRLSKRMLRCLRATDTVARIGGDEFVVILAPPIGTDDSLAIANKLREELSNVIEIDGVDLKVSACIGVAHYPTHSSDAQDLQVKADTAMYAAKRAGGNCVVIYSKNLNRMNCG